MILKKHHSERYKILITYFIVLTTNDQFHKFKENICYRYQCERPIKNSVCETRKVPLYTLRLKIII